MDIDQDVIDLSKIRLPRFSPRLLLGIVIAVVLLMVALGAFYQVEPEEVGVVTRFGAYVRTTDSGLHFKLPFIEAVQKVPVERQLKQEFGFRTVEPGIRSTFASVPDESIMLTGDLNVAVVEWIVQYRVSDPYKYLFKVRNVEDTFRDMNEAVMRAVVGDRTVTEVLTVGRQEIEGTVKIKLQEMAKAYDTGITVDQVVLQDVNPPDPVKPSWDAVNQAQQQRDRLINEARGEYNKVVPRAKGEAQQTILQAEGYALDRINRARGDAARFNSLYAEYRRAPQVTRRRMYLETVQRVLPRLRMRIYVDQGAQGIIPLLSLDGLGKIVGSKKKGGSR